MEFLTTLLSHQVANTIFLVLFLGGLGLAVISVIFGSITDAVGGIFDLDADGFGWISFTTICIGISGTGAGGFLFNSLDIPPILVLLIGLVIGFLCAYCAGRFIIIPLKRHQYSGVFKPEEVVGKTATVIAPMAHNTRGEIMVAGRSITASPVTPDLTFSSGDLVRVVRMENTIAFVEKEIIQEDVEKIVDKSGEQTTNGAVDNNDKDNAGKIADEIGDENPEAKEH